MEEKKKRGRPPIPSEECKSNSVRIRLTDSQFKSIKEKAVAEGVTVSDYIREKIDE